MLYDRYERTAAMNGLRLEKYHGLGNDFLIAITDELPDDATGSARARKFCRRRRGVGADGLIFATVDPVAMRLWNSDGSVAEVSGNGLRCLAHALARLWVLPDMDVVIDTVVGSRRCCVRSGLVSDFVESLDSGTSAGVEGGLANVTVAAEMGTVGVGGTGSRTGSESPDLASVVEKVTGIVVERWETADVGNPHVVLAVADPSAVPVAVAGPAVEALFPGGINVHFVSAGDGSAARCGDIVMRIWERGAGITEACGTGAVAATAVLNSWGYTGDHATVHMPGGNAVVSLTPQVTLTGPSTYVATVVIDRV